MVLLIVFLKEGIGFREGARRLKEVVEIKDRDLECNP